jgi:catechol 2,3-dioxygenase-like lactoylglutathione lyase family enzyme
MPQLAAAEKERLVVGLSHVPVAVRDLDEARRRAERLGFALKPGRPHDDGIRNLHIKFRDGTEVELITASEGRDELTSEYVAFLRDGDGPAFLALHAPSSPRLARALRAAGMSPRAGDWGIGFPSGDALHHIFFGGLNQSPTDRPEHFAHRNGAESLIAVWLVADDRAPYERMLARVGARPRGTAFLPPLGLSARRVPLPAGEILLLPGRARRVATRPIVGLTLRVRDVEAARRLLRGAGSDLPLVDVGERGQSVFLPPDLAGGFWLELREVREVHRPEVR